MTTAAERELWIIGREFERPPYFHAGKGGDTRLARALRLCLDGGITPNSDGSYTVEGRAHRRYRVAESCSCPGSQQGSSRWCYHAVGVALYIEWHRRQRGLVPAPASQAGARDPDGDAQPRGTAPPLDDATLALPLGPVTIEDRLAQAPQEVSMPTDDALSIPEPQAAPAVPDAPDPASATPVKIPREFTVTIKGRTHVLYTGLVLAARAHGLLSLSADWTYNDADLSLAHAVCTFRDGRRYEESGDASPANVSTGIALHFRRVALTRAKARCLRDALGISECSVEELEEETGKRDVPDLTRPRHEQDLRQRIWTRVRELAPDVATRAAAEAVVARRTGLALRPDNYQAILDTLSGEVSRNEVSDETH